LGEGWGYCYQGCLTNEPDCIEEALEWKKYSMNGTKKFRLERIEDVEQRMEPAPVGKELLEEEVQVEGCFLNAKHLLNY
jgi:hypothetical protein